MEEGSREGSLRRQGRGKEGGWREGGRKGGRERRVGWGWIGNVFILCLDKL